MKSSPKFSKLEIQKQINKIFFENPISPKIKKIKKIAMSENIKLGSFRKLFCKKCYTLFDSKNSEIRIKKKNKIPIKIIKCKNCGFISRYKLD